jgi:hypothetical protein
MKFLKKKAVVTVVTMITVLGLGFLNVDPKTSESIGGSLGKLTADLVVD